MTPIVQWLPIRHLNMKLNDNKADKSLQERLAEVFPTSKGNECPTASFERDLAEDLSWAEQFDLKASHTEHEWRRLDLIVSRYGVWLEKPELFDAVKDHFSVTLYHDTLYQIVHEAINTVNEIHQNTNSAQAEIDAFDMMFAEILPPSVRTAVNSKMYQLFKEVSLAKKVDKPIFTSEFSDYGGGISVYFTCAKGKFYASVSSRVTPSECLIFRAESNGEIDWRAVYTNRHMPVSKESLIAEIEKFCKE